MPRVKLILEYDGTDYAGWQVQANAPSIQARVEQALSELLSEPVSVAAAGRTDAGVHALGQVACFDTSRLLPMKAYAMGLNGLLPEDIAVVRAEEVDAAFDPRRWSSGKRYRYLISNKRHRSPLRRRTHWQIFQPLDVEAMRAASTCLLGRHDFSAFRAADCQAHHAMRELRLVEIGGASGDELAITIEGTAFLKHMVRNIVGSLVEVGRGRRPVAWMKEVLDSRDRDQAGPTAPAQALTLVEVFYPAAPPGSQEAAAPDDE